MAAVSGAANKKHRQAEALEVCVPLAGTGSPLPVGAGTLPQHAVNLGQVDAAVATSLGAGGLLAGRLPGALGAARDVEGKLREFVSLADFVPDTPTPKRTALLTGRSLDQDITTELQQAVNWCMDNNYGLEVQGAASISDTIEVKPRGGAQYCQFWMRGRGAGYDGSAGLGGARSPAVFVFTKKDRPCLSINSYRGVYLGHFGIVGPNVAPLSVTSPTHDGTQYFTSGVTDGRYGSGLNLIALDDRQTDPGAGSRVPYGSGTATYLGGSFGARFLAEGLFLYGGACGLNIAPDSAGLQNDDVTLIGCVFRSCRAGIGIGQSQTRGLAVYNCQFNSVQMAWDGFTYGRQQGYLQLLSGGETVLAYILGSQPTGFGQTQIVNHYAENIRALLRVGSGANNGGMENLISGHYALGSTYKRNPFLSAVYGGLTYNGCTIQDRMTAGSDAFNFLGVDRLINLKAINLSLNSGNMTASIVGVAPDYTNQPRLHIEDVRIADGTSTFIIGERRPRQFSPAGRLPLSYFSQTVETASAFYQVQKSAASNTYFNAATSADYAWTVTGETATVTFTATTIAQFLVGMKLFWKCYEPLIGSTQAQEVPALTVTGIAGSVVTASADFNPAGYVTDGSFVPANIKRFVEAWAPAQATTGDISNVTTPTTILNVTPLTVLNKNGLFVSGATAGIPTQTFVVSGAGTASVVISQAATAAVTGNRLFWDRLVPITLTTASAI